MQRLIWWRRADPVDSRIRGVAVRLGVVAALAGNALAATAGAGVPAWTVPGGDAQRGSRWIQTLGCARCHEVPGVKGAHGNVGPPLTRFGDRTFIAGILPNTPSNLIKWIREPQSVLPGNAMPNTGISEGEARDIAAYLYTLR